MTQDSEVRLPQPSDSVSTSLDAAKHTRGLTMFSGLGLSTQHPLSGTSNTGWDRPKNIGPKRTMTEPHAQKLARSDSGLNNVRKDIDLRDGKTKQCDRKRTFDTFVHEKHLGKNEPATPMGHSWEALRALTSVMKQLQKASGKLKGRRERR